MPARNDRGQDADPAVHPDLIHFRQWVDRLVTNFDGHTSASRRVQRRRTARAERRRLSDIQQSYMGSPTGKTKDVLRGLMASGVARYALSAAPAAAQTALGDQIMLDLGVIALWPIVIAPRLPKGWFDALQELASPSVARLVAQARLSATTGQMIDASTFYRAMTRVPFAFGLINALDDLNDPRRGAGVMAALAFAGDAPEPSSGGGARQLLKWVLGASAAGAAVDGIIGNRADAAFVSAWDWLVSAIDSGGFDISASHGSHGSSNFDPFGSSASQRSSQPSGLIDIIEGLFR